MSLYAMDNQKAKYIAETFNLNEESVMKLFQRYEELSVMNKKQYLAHIMRSLKQYIRDHCKAPFFRITCRESSSNPELKGTGCASYKKGQSFTVLYDSQLEPKQARIVIAHELGICF